MDFLHGCYLSDPVLPDLKDLGFLVSCLCLFPVSPRLCRKSSADVGVSFRFISTVLFSRLFLDFHLRVYIDACSLLDAVFCGGLAQKSKFICNSGHIVFCSIMVLHLGSPVFSHVSRPPPSLPSPPHLCSHILSLSPSTPPRRPSSATPRHSSIPQSPSASITAPRASPGHRKHVLQS